MSKMSAGIINYVKPWNKRFTCIIPLQKDSVILAFVFFSRKGVEIHLALCTCLSVSVRANDVNNTESQ